MRSAVRDAIGCFSVNEKKTAKGPVQIRKEPVPICYSSHWLRGGGIIRDKTVAQPFIVSIPHKLGKDEAVRRLKAGLGNIRSEYGNIFQVNEEIWSGDRLAFQVTALKQRVSGSIDVAEDHVRLEVLLPWLLAGLAHGIQATIRARAGRMLEKKTTDV